MKRSEAGLAWLLASPAVAVIVLVSLVPVIATFWESLHVNDLRLPWLGRPFIGAANYLEAAADPRFRDAVIHTVGFAIVSVPLELFFGLALALVMHNAVRARGMVRVTALLPWAIPTVAVALVWRFMFEATAGSWLVDPVLAWVPVVLADVWKTTPFVAILLLAGLQTIDPAVDEAARLDGAGPFRHLATITLPLLAPALLVAGVFRVLDALRVFDLVYVLTGGGPGTATEPLSLYAFTALTQRLRFGYGSALSVTVFLLAFSCALLAVRMLTRQGEENAAA